MRYVQCLTITKSMQMNKMIIIVFSLLISINGFSQTESIHTKINTSKTPVGVDKSKPKVLHTEKAGKEFTISKKAGEEQVVHNDAYYLDQISKIDQHINSINVKIAHVKSDEAENTKALKSGWFDSMDNTLVRLNEKKASFQTKLNK